MKKRLSNLSATQKPKNNINNSIEVGVCEQIISKEKNDDGCYRINDDLVLKHVNLNGY